MKILGNFQQFIVILESIQLSLTILLLSNMSGMLLLFQNFLVVLTDFEKVQFTQNSHLAR